MGTKIDHYISDRVPNTFIKQLPHTYIERKPPSDQEYMWASREQSIRYVCLDKVWPHNINSVYGINCLGLNLEFVEYKLGDKGILGNHTEHAEHFNKNVEV